MCARQTYIERAPMAETSWKEEWLEDQIQGPFKTLRDRVEFEVLFLRLTLFRLLRRPPSQADVRFLNRNQLAPARIYGESSEPPNNLMTSFGGFLEHRKRRYQSFRKHRRELIEALDQNDAAASALAMCSLQRTVEGAKFFVEELPAKLRAARSIIEQNRERRTVSDDQIVAAISRLGSITGAAAHLGITPQAIGKRIPPQRRQRLLKAAKRKKAKLR